jgi:hypothetical protein
MNAKDVKLIQLDLNVRLILSELMIKKLSEGSFH